MRYCKRTFFNKLFQPHRIGKAIFLKPIRMVVLRIHERREWCYTHSPFRPKQTMLEERLKGSPKNLIIGRHSRVRCFKLFTRRGLKRLQSIFVRRAKQYEST